MKKAAWLFILLTAIISLTGCGIASNEAPTSESNFLSSFDIGSIIDANKAYLISGSSLPITSQTSSEPSSSFFQKHEGAVVEVSSSNTSEFMQAIKLQIHQMLTDREAEILGASLGGPGGTTYFSFRYSLDDVDGLIHVWGVQGEGTRLTLIVLITEG